MRPTGLLAILAVGAQSLSTRRLLTFLSGILLLSTALLLFTSANLSTQDLNKGYGPNIFRPATHQPPPPVTNSTGSTEGWFASWTWIKPFSASDNHRVALPPLQKCPIYTYYEPAKDKTQAALEDEMLLAWRRTWWAYGFEPMILGLADAKKSGFYEVVHRANAMKELKSMTPELKKELMRWIAWNYVEAGILVHHRVLPMGPHDDVTISALRRCKFLYMSNYQKFEQKLYTSDKTSLNKILMHVTSDPPPTAKTVEEALKTLLDKPDELMHVDAFPAALADYSPEVVDEKYKELNPSDLPGLVNAHLHSTFLSHYPEGITLLSPFPLKLGALNHPGLELAHRVAACPVNNPLPNSCPPNVPKCRPCKKPADVITHDHLSDSTKSFTIGTIPHPLITLELTNDNISLLLDKEDHSKRYIRRHAPRDPWIKEATKAPFMKQGLGPAPRATKLKETIAAKAGTKFLSMWSTEKIGFKDIEWTLGFVPPTIRELEKHLPLAEEAQMKLKAMKVVLNRKSTLVDMIESWCLSDTEVWRFVNAWRERRVLERMQWTKKEKRFGLGLDKAEQ